MQNEIKALLDITSSLRAKYKLGFPLDGRLVGDIGEALVQKSYHVELHHQNTNCYDAQEIGTNRQIQIKSSMKYNYSYSYQYNPDYYLAVHINEDASLEEIYNGPGQIIKDYITEHGLKAYNQTWYPLTANTLRSLNKAVKDSERIKRKVQV